MPITKAKTMLVRLPVEIAEDLIKLRNDRNLSTIGSALKFWIEQQSNERIESKLNELQTAIQESNQVKQLDQANILVNSNMIAMIFKAIGPEIITDDPEIQKKIKDGIKYLENNQAGIHSFVQAALDQGKKLQKKYPVKQEKTEGNRVNS
ncbi:hypothetical protein ES703_29963 [subsurface metagenome]